jgi:hypothetical protein
MPEITKLNWLELLPTQYIIIFYIEEIDEVS